MPWQIIANLAQGKPARSPQPALLWLCRSLLVCKSIANSFLLFTLFAKPTASSALMLFAEELKVGSSDLVF